MHPVVYNKKLQLANKIAKRNDGETVKNRRVREHIQQIKVNYATVRSHWV